MPNESYYAAQKAARAIGTNSIDNAARVCHSPSTFGLKEALGVAASTCSYSDWIGTDLIVFIGSNVANNQPVTTKYLHQAKKAGTRVAVLNPLREPGMERYWIPSKAESALFGTKIADDFFGLNIGGDVAFLTGVLRHLIERGWVDEEFVAAHTDGFAELRDAVLDTDWEELELGGRRQPRRTCSALARLIGEREARDPGLEHGGDPARGRRGRRAGDREPGARARLGRQAGLRPDADPRPLGRPGRGRDGLLLRPRSRAGCR